MCDWKAEIVRIAYWKQIAAEQDKLHALPWHLPRVAASEQSILAAQGSVGIEFPSEFRDFLRHANGWPGFIVTTDLFGTDDFISGRWKRVLDRKELADFIAGTGLGRGNVIPIGASDVDLNVFLMVSPYAKVLPGGIIWFASEEVERYGSFSEFFASMVNYNAQVAREFMEEAGQ